ncbi:hypothetical protein [Paenibacillus mucilaginosus]|uniref:Uncharacterized protein n=1 Tax=Paenibacillus mucilaginosus (strain KNP414) TaxID=1036673 RepID=F8FE40_PAEMK|nr:hypothetical protein [Paenibacillus mucilaginosus]AEI43799.1 hypothetical protein KNP414_05275 [Paenibacillus mucilaginosus KNP414]MCG7212682.1 hypothetical protein [Paenibacillus mucilaginosus]WDM25299.1 hypothetical protein KCX80_22895 [Paenibacillus mucilaginosus]
MWPILGVLSAAALILLYEAPGLRRSRRYRELAVFLILLTLGTGAGLAEAADVPLPNPLDWMNYLFGPAGERLDKVLRLPGELGG